MRVIDCLTSNKQFSKQATNRCSAFPVALVLVLTLLVSTLLLETLSGITTFVMAEPLRGDTPLYSVSSSKTGSSQKFSRAVASPLPSVQRKREIKFRPKVSGFSLVNVDTGERLLALRSGTSIDRGRFKSTRVGIRADSEPGVSRVVFSLNGREVVENVTDAPFVFKNITPEQLFATDPEGKPRMFELAATAYAEKTQGETKSIRLRFVESESGPAALDRSPETEQQTSHLARAKLAEPAEKDSEIRRDRASGLAPTAGKIERPRLQSVVHTESGIEAKGRTRCVGLLHYEVERLTVVCSHGLVGARHAALVAADADGVMHEICEFPDAASPMVTSCASTAQIVTALKTNQLSVSVSDKQGASLHFPVESN